MTRAPALIFACAAILAACSYDLDVLKGRRTDGGADVVDASVDRVVPDVSVDVRPDVPVDMGPADAGVRDASMGACALPGVTTLPPTANHVSVIEGTTVDAGTPALSLENCPQRQISSFGPSRIFRYQMQAGTRLFASTNTGLCGSNDTILSAFLSCDTGARPLACNDDDSRDLCASCVSAMRTPAGGCGEILSTISVDNLVPGDVVYLMVSAYSAGMTAPFRLTVAENGVELPALTAVDGGLGVSPQCACPTMAGTATPTTVTFPMQGDTNQLALSNRLILGSRMVPQRVYGVSARLALSQLSVSTAGGCQIAGMTTTGAIDLSIGPTVVATIPINAATARPGFITVPYNPVALSFGSGSTLTQFQYTVRSTTPGVPATCFDVAFNLGGSNSVTLYGNAAL